MLRVRALRPKQMPTQPLMPVDKGVDAVGVNTERNDKRLLALALQRVGLTGAKKQMLPSVRVSVPFGK